MKQLVSAGLTLRQTVEKLQGCLEKNSLERSQTQGIRFSDCPEGRSPEGQFDYPKNLPWAFPLFVRLWGSTTEKDEAEGLPE